MVGEDTSIAIDSQGKVHISYGDYTNYDLKYITNTTGIWVVETLDRTGNVGWYNSIAVDSKGKVHISYDDFTNYDLKYITNATGVWMVETLDSTGDVGWYNSITVDNSDRVHISYFDRTNSDLKYAKKCFAMDFDCDDSLDYEDNCPNHYNPLQEDTCPPQGNLIGDACDCEANFDCDEDCDGTDAATFKVDFGRSTFLNPCTNEYQCHGDFDCDVDVDGTDAALFKVDFGRSQFSNPCPACVVGDWCVYE
jgi:hypothetical protein